MSRRRSSIVRKAVGCTVGAAVLYLFFCTGIWTSADNEYEDRALYGTHRVLIEAWQFNVSQPQPLSLGGSLEGTRGNLHVRGTWRSVLGIKVNAAFEPGSSLRIELRDNRYTCIAEIPYDKVRFDRSLTDPQGTTAQFLVTDTLISEEYPKFKKGNFFVLGGMPFKKIRGPNVTDVDGWKNIETGGVCNFVKQHLERLDLMLTEAQYQQYFHA